MLVFQYLDAMMLQTLMPGSAVLVLSVIVSLVVSSKSPSTDIWSKLTRESGEPVNRDLLISQYFLLCGSFVCNKSLIPIETSRGLIPNITAFGDCFCNCDSACFKTGNCCPDMAIAYLEHVCFNTQVYPNPFMFFASSKNFKMIAKCPSNSLQADDISMCETSADFDDIFADKNVPVTSADTHITYRNKYCAKCYGEQNFISWDLRVSCVDTVDFVQFSTTEELWKAITENHCTVTYEPGQEIESFVSECYGVLYDMINSCNASGLWQTNDPDIDWACRNLDSPYGKYKNIFCYICNPSLASTLTSTNRIDKCNVTGDWQGFVNDIQRACEELPGHPRLGPFKNIFCLLCNTEENTLAEINRSVFNKGVNFETEDKSYYGGTGYSYFISPVGNIGNEVKTYLGTHFNTVPQHSDTPKYADAPVREALTKYAELCGTNAVCDVDVLSKRNIMNYNITIPVCGACSCKPSCVFTKTCCVDIVLSKEPFQCISENVLSTAKTDMFWNIASFKAVNTCLPKSTPGWLEMLCASDEDGKDIFSYFPVKDSNRDNFFKNAYCAACNEQYEVDLVEIEITCIWPLEPTLFLSLVTLIHVAQENECKIILQSNTYGKCDETVLGLDEWTDPISRCNVTGAWEVNDEIIREFCERNSSIISNLQSVRFSGYIYRNVFCFMCNPEPSNTLDVISHCNITGDWNVYDSDIEHACEVYPQHIRWHPYKNWYCLSCNVPQFQPDIFFMTFNHTDYHYAPNDSRHNSDIHYPVLDKLAVSTKKSIFTLKPRQQSLFRRKNISRKKCDNGTLDLTTQICRKIYCPEGRVLINETCQPLLEEMENLGYQLMIGIDPLTNITESYQISVSDFSSRLPGAIIDTIGKLVEGSSEFGAVTPYSMLTNRSCDDVIDIEKHIPGDVPLMSLVFNITVKKTTNRSVLEDALIASRHRVYALPYEHTTIHFQAKPYSDAALLGVEPTHTITETCLWTVPSVSLIHEQRPSAFHAVSELLVCAMVELRSVEYTLDNMTNTVYMADGDTYFEENEFLKTDNNDIRICEKDYSNYRKLRQKTEEYKLGMLELVHGIFSYVSSTISLLCLFLTFVTYSLFQSLRTLPGKNNMCLSFCLFSAQATLQFGILADDNRDVCVTMGMMIHFFWLTTFCAMSVCSYHMYRVFCARSLQVGNSSDDMKIFLTYLAYVIGLPVAVVALNIAVNYGITEGRSSGYGEYLCFLSSMYAIIGAFIVPASVIFSSNIYFFVQVFRTIKNSPHLQSNQKEKRDAIVYLKLCTIIGLFWPLQIIDGIIGTTVLSFFVSILNDLQGVFIFVSFICNKRVISLYRRLLCGGRSWQNSERSPTASFTTSKGNVNNTINCTV